MRRLLTSERNSSGWTCPRVDLLNEAQEYRFAMKHGTLENFLTSATDVQHVAQKR